MAGRRPLSKAVHDARGHAGKRPGKTRQPNPQPHPATADPPVWVKEDKGALAIWNELIPERLRLGLHTVFDVNSFGSYCSAKALSIEAIRHIRKDGVVDEIKGVEKKSAWLSIWTELEVKIIRPFELENGGTPKARGSLHVAPAVPDAEREKEQLFG